MVLLLLLVVVVMMWMVVVSILRCKCTHPQWLTRPYELACAHFKSTSDVRMHVFTGPVHVSHIFALHAHPMLTQL